jgi:preprotein translocase subunit SecD
LSGDVPVILTNADIAAATVVDDGFGGYAVQIDFTPEAAEIMGAFSESHVGERLAIVMDGFVLSAPTIQTRVDTTALISGNFTQAQAQMIAVLVSFTPLPVKLELVSVG